MRCARLLGLVLATFITALLVAPHAGADQPFRLPGYVTDRAGALTDSDTTQVRSALTALYTDRKIRLWVVYVEDFSGQDGESWSKSAYRTSNLGRYDALLAVATVDRSYAFEVPTTITNVSPGAVSALGRDEIEPALGRGDWAAAAVAAANGLNVAGSPASTVSWVGLSIALGIVVIGLLGLVLAMRWRRRRRRAAEFAAAQRIDPTDADALAAASIDALDELSKTMVVEVDNAVRTSANELAVAVEEFGQAATEPFTKAVNDSKIALAQAFTVRQQLDDAIPETPAQRRELLTQVIVSAARADRELDAQAAAFAGLRDLVINAPAKLDTLTQQLVDVTARISPSEKNMTGLHGEFSDAALTSVGGNVTAASERIAFADNNITRGRALAAHPVAGQQSELVDSVRAAEAALGQARTLLDAVDSAAADIRRAAGMLPAAIADIRTGIAQADAQLAQANAPRADELKAARAAAASAAESAEATGQADPLGAFTSLTKADTALDALVATVASERDANDRLARSFEQALFTAQSRVRAVSDYIDTRRGSIGPEARTRLSEAVRQLEAAQATRATDLPEAIAYANGASMLAAQAQSVANTDVQSAQRVYSGGFGNPAGSNMGAMIGGLIIGNVLSGAMRGGFGGWTSTSFGSSSTPSDFMGSSGRF